MNRTERAFLCNVSLPPPEDGGRPGIIRAMTERGMARWTEPRPAPSSPSRTTGRALRPAGPPPSLLRRAPAGTPRARPPGGVLPLERVLRCARPSRTGRGGGRRTGRPRRARFRPGGGRRVPRAAAIATKRRQEGRLRRRRCAAGANGRRMAGPTAGQPPARDDDSREVAAAPQPAARLGRAAAVGDRPGAAGAAAAGAGSSARPAGAGAGPDDGRSLVAPPRSVEGEAAVSPAARRPLAGGEPSTRRAGRGRAPPRGARGPPAARPAPATRRPTPSSPVSSEAVRPAPRRAVRPARYGDEPARCARGRPAAVAAADPGPERRAVLGAAAPLRGLPDDQDPGRRCPACRGSPSSPGRSGSRRWRCSSCRRSSASGGGGGPSAEPERRRRVRRQSAAPRRPSRPRRRRRSTSSSRATRCRRSPSVRHHARGAARREHGQIKDPNKISVGDEIIIPVPGRPTGVGGSSGATARE